MKLHPRLLPLAAAALVLTGCNKPEDQETPPPVVTVATVQEREVQDFVVFTGRTAAEQKVEIRARVSGYLIETKFQDGQEVKKGAPLFIIDPRPYQADLDRAQAGFDQAQADLQLAAIEYNRSRDLRLKNAISAQDFDAKSAGYLKAQGSLAVAKADLDTAKLNLEFTTITSPIDGQTSKASVTPGNLVTPDMQDPLTVIVSTNPIYAYADIDERQLLKYIRLQNSLDEQGDIPETVPGESKKKQPKTPIQLQLADEKSFPHTGYIDFSDNRVNSDTGTISIRGVFQDDGNLLGPGMFVRLRFPGGPSYKGLLVPQESIGTDQGQKFVFIVKPDGVAEQLRIVPGALQDDGWRVVTGDVHAGDSVIVEGILKARSGEIVSPQPWTDPAATPTPAEAGQ